MSNVDLTLLGGVYVHIYVPFHDYVMPWSQKCNLIVQLKDLLVIVRHSRLGHAMLLSDLVETFLQPLNLVTVLRLSLTGLYRGISHFILRLHLPHC